MLKNISLPLFHRRGMSREGGSVFTTQFHLSLPPYLRVVLTYLFCFFSSRRRHTSLTCDWSSDVCSSDLKRINLPPRQVARRVTRQLKRPVLRPSCTRRSEERRVGKECRSRWSAYHEQKKGGKRAGNRGTVLEGRRGGEGRPEHETT